MKEKNMEKEIIFLVKELYFQDIGIMIIKFRVNWFCSMEMYLMDVSKITNDFKESINIETEMSMKVLGKMT